MSQRSDAGFLNVEFADDVTVVKLNPAKLDDSNTQAIGQQLTDLAERSGRHKLHLDLGNLEYMDSRGLGKFVAVYKKVKAAGGQFRLYNVNAPVYEVFQLTNLHQLLDVRQKQAG